MTVKKTTYKKNNKNETMTWRCYPEVQAFQINCSVCSATKLSLCLSPGLGERQRNLIVTLSIYYEITPQENKQKTHLLSIIFFFDKTICQLLLHRPLCTKNCLMDSP